MMWFNWRYPASIFLEKNVKGYGNQSFFAVFSKSPSLDLTLTIIKYTLSHALFLQERMLFLQTPGSST